MFSLENSAAPLRSRVLMLCIVVTLYLVSPTQTYSEELQAVPNGAQIVLDRYFNALRVGDVGDLENLFGGALKIRRRHLLNSPEYAQSLRDKHSGSVFTVTSVDTINNDMIRITVEIESVDETIRKQLYLAHQSESEGSLSFRIVEERVSM